MDTWWTPAAPRRGLGQFCLQHEDQAQSRLGGHLVDTCRLEAAWANSASSTGWPPALDQAQSGFKPRPGASANQSLGLRWPARFTPAVFPTQAATLRSGPARRRHRQPSRRARHARPGRRRPGGQPQRLGEPGRAEQQLPEDGGRPVPARASPIAVTVRLAASVTVSNARAVFSAKLVCAVFCNVVSHAPAK